MVPCAEVLSVAGFFDINGPFPLGRAVIPEGRKASFLTREASLLQLRVKSVILHYPSTTSCGLRAGQCTQGGWETRI